MVAWNAFMDKYYPGGDKKSTFPAYAYAVTSTVAEVLKRAGDNLTRENIMKQAASLKGVEIPVAAARHQDQHQRDGLLSDPVGAAGTASRVRPSSCSATSCPASPNSQSRVSCPPGDGGQLALYKPPTGHTLPGGLFRIRDRTCRHSHAPALHCSLPASSAASARLTAAAFDRARAARRLRLRGAGRAPGRLRRAAAAQRFRLSGSLAGRRPARRLCGAHQLAFQGRRGRLRAGRLRRQGAGGPCRPAGRRRRRRSRRREGAGGRDAAGDRQLPMAAAPSGAPPGATAWDAWLAGQEPLAGRAAAADLEHDLHLRHHRPAQGRAPPAAHGRPRSAHGRLPRARLRPQARRAHHDPGPALPLRAQRVCAARRPRRQPDRADAALRSGGLPGPGREAPHRGHVHGADHVRAPAQAAGRGAQPLRSVVAQVRHARGRALPARDQARR